MQDAGMDLSRLVEVIQLNVSKQEKARVICCGG